MAETAMIYSYVFRDAQFYSRLMCGVATAESTDGGDKVKLAIPVEGADGYNEFIIDLREDQIDSLIKTLVSAKSMFTRTGRMINSELNDQKIEAWLEPNY